MQHFLKEWVAPTIFVLGLISLFVFTFLMTTNSIADVSAVEANGVQVYWDSNCTDIVLSVDWGTLQPGSVKDVVFFCRNERDEVEEPICLTMLTTNWNPANASDFIALRWDYTGQHLDLGDTLQVQLTLSISRHIEGISSFSFDIIIIGSDITSLLGDVKDDGIVDIHDTITAGLAFGSMAVDDPTTPLDETVNWNPDADFNNDGRVDMIDLTITEVNFGKK